MNDNNKKWKAIFLFCAGITIGTSFCMKWLENDFVSDGHKFTIIGLEIFYSKQQVFDFVTGIDPSVQRLLKFHLTFDFVFMAGIYPGIAALCMRSRNKLRSISWKNFFLLLAILQLFAWTFDIAENIFLLKWLYTPSLISKFLLYHIVVASKWILALAGLISSLFVVFRRTDRISPAI
jgi:hypothetical protein